jgi:Flp pilus assembly protein TadB
MALLCVTAGVALLSVGVNDLPRNGGLMAAGAMLVAAAVGLVWPLDRRRRQRQR